MPPENQRKARTRKTKAEAVAPEAQPKTVTRKSKPNALVSPNAEYSEPEWMRRWLEFAADAKDIAGACKDAEVSIADFLLARTGDETFDASCLIFDQITELRIIDTIRRQAQEGAAPAQGLYFKSARRPSFAPRFASWLKGPEPETILPPPKSLPAEVAGAMIEAGLKMFDQLNRPSEPSSEPPGDRPQLPGPEAAKR